MKSLSGTALQLYQLARQLNTPLLFAAENASSRRKHEEDLVQRFFCAGDTPFGSSRPRADELACGNNASHVKILSCIKTSV
jgi:hypothetical protein